MLRNGLLAAGLIAIAFLYTFRLGSAPIYLVHDEVMFGLQADSIARTGRGLGGDRLPLYFSEPGFEAGRDPMSIYLTAAVLRVLPLSEFSVRLPTALVGVLDVALVFAVGRRLFGSVSAAVLSAFCVAAAPAHFIHSRMALDFVYPLPFVLAWLWCMVEYFESRRTIVLAAGMVALGAGVYSYLAALLLMPMYFVFTCIALYVLRRPARDYAVAAAAFAVPLLPLVAWQVIHPARYADLLNAYRLFDAAPGQRVEGVTRLGGPGGVLARLDVFWSFFNPGFLFFTGDSSQVNSTRLVGVLLTPALVWLAVGSRGVAAKERGDAGRLVLLGLLTAPAGVVLMGALEIRRAMVVVPFAALLAGYGADRLLHARPRLARAAAVVLVALACVQFGGFLRDYFGPYRERSAYWFGGNLRGALTAAIDELGRGSDQGTVWRGSLDPRSVPPQPVFLSSAIPSVIDYWRFYTRARGRADLVDRGTVADVKTFDVQAAPAGALFVGPAAQPVALDASWSRVSLSTEPNGAPAFAVFRKR